MNKKKSLFLMICLVVVSTACQKNIIPPEESYSGGLLGPTKTEIDQATPVETEYSGGLLEPESGVIDQVDKKVSDSVIGGGNNNSEYAEGSLQVESTKSVRHENSTAMIKLVVHVKPEDAQIRVLNIVPKYQPNMELPPGKYHLEVSKPGYLTEILWAEVAAGEDIEWKVVLKEKPPISAESSSPSSGYEGGLLGPN